MGEKALFEIADSQQGFFTSQQAQSCGIPRPNFHRKLRSGEWTREGRGIYRLVQYPLTDRPELVLWSLWSRNRQDEPQGVWSHETALDFYEICDVMPPKMHMTVPKGFRRRREVPKVLILHHATLQSSDYQEHQGFRVTTPLRTLVDVVEQGTQSVDIIAQALAEALRIGLISRGRLEQETPQLLEYLHE